MKVQIINGPNLNLLGSRETNIYGTETLADIENWFFENIDSKKHEVNWFQSCLLYTSPSPRDRQKSRMPSSA